MVAKIITGKSIRGALSYNEQKVSEGKATLIASNMFGCDVGRLTFAGKAARFTALLEKNKKVKTNTVHISLNFDPGERLSDEQLCRIAESYMQQIGFGDQPYLVYRHCDAGHPHIHVVTTNVQYDGSRIDLHNIGRTRSEAARKNVEREFGLVEANAKKLKEAYTIPAINLTPAEYGTEETRKAIGRVVSAVVRSWNVTSMAEYNAALQSLGVLADRGTENSMLFRRGGLRYCIVDGAGNKKGIPVKASALPGKPTLKTLEAVFEKSKEHRKLFKASLKLRVDHALSNVSATQPVGTALSQQQIRLLLRENEAGHIYGVTYIDLKNRAVINGSDLGKEYSAKALLDRYGAEALRAPRADASQSNRLHHSNELRSRKPATAVVAKSESMDLLLDPVKESDYQPAAFKKRKKKKNRRIN